MQSQAIPPAQTQEPERAKPLHVKDIAHATGWSKATVYAEIAAGRLPHYRVGTGRGSIRVTRAAFADYLTERGIPAAELAVEL